MDLWFSTNHGIEFSEVGTIFQESFRAECEDCFMAEIISVNDSLEIC